MKKSMLVVILLPLLVITLAGVSQAWQGRMAGMNDPYGLLMDESDFLIHPAKIANGEGIKYYGYYRFTYTDVIDWDYTLRDFDLSNGQRSIWPYRGSGDEYRHDAQVGAGFPLGPGRMGLFAAYDGMGGKYDGHENELYNGPPYSDYHHAYVLQSDVDDFLFRLLYGMPVGGFKVGGEVQLAYRQGMNKTGMLEDLVPGPDGPYTLWINFFEDPETGWRNLFPFMLPYDSNYWETLLKGSLEGDVGPLDVEFTLRGGFIFSGDNNYEYEDQQPPGTLFASADLDGNVKGWRMGGDLWVRYPVDSFSFPFLVRVDYQTKTRDGDGPGSLAATGNYFDYEHNERDLAITAGGGLDMEFNEATRIAAGIYYNYLNNEQDLWFMVIDPRGAYEIFDYNRYPAHTEHQAMVRLAFEHEFSPAFSLRMGMDCFYGWIMEDFDFTYHNSLPYTNTDDISLDGSRWGIGGSIGGTLTFNDFSLEPFVNVGYQELNLDGDGEGADNGGAYVLFDMDKTRSEWYIGGGLSFLYDLP